MENFTFNVVSKLSIAFISPALVEYKDDDLVQSTGGDICIEKGYVNLKNRLGRRPILLDFYENAEMDPLVIIKEYKTYYSFAEQMEKNEQLFRLSEQEKTTLEYLSKTILSGVRPDELEILRLFLEKNQITYSEVIDSC